MDPRFGDIRAKMREVRQRAKQSEISLMNYFEEYCPLLEEWMAMGEQKLQEKSGIGDKGLFSSRE